MHFRIVSLFYLLFITGITCTPERVSLKPSEVIQSFNITNNELENKVQFILSEKINETEVNEGESEEGDYEDTPEQEEDVETDDIENVTERPKGKRQRTRPRVTILGITYTWGKWEKWSRCINTCVQIRKRACIKRIQNSTSLPAEEISFYPDLELETTGCQGVMRKYRLCKDDRCTARSSIEMRNEQCAAFNSIIIRGRFHQWLGHEKDDNECSLCCQAKDTDMIMDMQKLVMDGTPCQRPSIYYTHYYRRRAVCVEGICRVS